MARSGASIGLGIAAFISSLGAVALILLVLLPGVNNGLTNFYYMKTDMSNFAVPSKLSNSSFLRELSTVSGRDFVGSDATPSSLGLANEYTVNILTSCALGDKPTCSTPRFGFMFNPNTDLKISSTALQGTGSASYTSALNWYNKLSLFFAAGYVAAAGLVLLAALAGALPSGRGAVLCGTLLSILATALLVAVAASAGIVFHNLVAAINADFGPSGLNASPGPIAPKLAYAACGLSFLSTILMSVRTCYAGGSSGGRGRRSIRGGVLVTGEQAGPAEPMPGMLKKTRTLLLGKIPTWRGVPGQGGGAGHTYVQIEKQPAVVRAAAVPPAQRAPLSDAADWSAEDHDQDELAAPAGAPSGIALRSMGHGAGRTQDVATAYEPYSNSGV